jgi:hypothetical protein
MSAIVQGTFRLEETVVTTDTLLAEAGEGDIFVGLRSREELESFLPSWVIESG